MTYCLKNTKPPDQRENLSKFENAKFFYDWRIWAREEQLPPKDDDWRTWMILAGRGFGKTRTGAEWVRAQVKKGARLIGLIAPTAADARDIMVEGESGLLSVCWEADVTDKGVPMGRPVFQSSRRRVCWENGATAMLFSAEEPDRLRGPQHECIWADELGCPAATSRAREPNAFVDTKSAEGRLPVGSTGARDDTEQRNFLQAHHDYWRENSDQNPTSSVYGGAMIDVDRIYNWAWDARPYPVFPLNEALWSDGQNWALGHWLNGRLGTAPVADVFAKIFEDHRQSGPRIKDVSGPLAGVLVSAPNSVRGTIEPLMQLCGVGASDDNGDDTLVLSGHQGYIASSLTNDDLVEIEREALLTNVRAQSDELPSEIMLTYRDIGDNYRVATSYSRRLENTAGGQIIFDAPAIIDEENAYPFVETILSNLWLGKSTVTFRLPADYATITTGDVFAFDDAPNQHWQVVRTALGENIELECRQVSKPLSPTPGQNRPTRSINDDVARGFFGGSPEVLTLDLPNNVGAADGAYLSVAVRAQAKQSQVVYSSPASEGFQYKTTISGAATIGKLTAPLSPTVSGRFDRATALTVELSDGEFESISEELLLAGRNLIAVKANNDVWEVIQFKDAQELSPNVWALTGLLRGQGGTEDAMIAGAAMGASVLLLNEEVGRIALTDTEVGLDINYRIGPANKEFTERFFSTATASGGLRNLLPLSPVHLKAHWSQTNDLRLSWVRRSRTGGDNWQALDVPLGEETEQYILEVFDTKENVIFQTVTNVPNATISAAQISALYAHAPTTIHFSVRQISQRVGPGTKAETKISI